ncbi:DUF1772-domain-containing protein [Lipomyces tetrasporus]|uniref:DUF1772-domain-containing protein n=1 Tax=Lipomyces tetrasporus TaxID=54092 RepID=A0AAD7VPD8_9ASCO|nr:DUF1772-domain-containing protein [Lipomyces tetrasporus]KAJ8096611.1 DUF1772-domain-containing protein [Lipomyces tetrasporus]
MAASGISFRVAQAVGVGGALWLSGNIAALSLISIPALVRSQTEDSVPTSILSRQWKYTFEAGKSQNPPIAVATATSFCYLAWSVRAGTQLGRLVPRNSIALYCIAAILTIGIVPFTIIAMTPTNSRLIAIAEQKRDAGGSVKPNDEPVEVLMKKWMFLNGIRSFLPLLAGATALVAVLG